MFLEVLISLYFFKSEPAQPARQDQQQAYYLVPGQTAGPSHFTWAMAAQELKKKTDQAVVDQIKGKNLARETAFFQEQKEENKIGET
jgi:hypothetical protein